MTRYPECAISEVLLRHRYEFIDRFAIVINDAYRVLPNASSASVLRLVAVIPVCLGLRWLERRASHRLPELSFVLLVSCDEAVDHEG